MADSRLIMQQRRDLAAYEKVIMQLEQANLQYRALLEEAVSVACAFAFDIGLGNAPLTYEQVRQVLVERQQQEEQPKRTGGGGP